MLLQCGVEVWLSVDVVWQVRVLGEFQADTDADAEPMFHLLMSMWAQSPLFSFL